MLQPFQVENAGAGGRLVRLGQVVETVLARHAYPEPVAALLAETLALAALIGGAFKFEGVLTVQAKGDGPVPLLMADVTNRGEMRGYAQYDAARLDRALSRRDAEAGPREPVPLLLGAGHLAFTVDQGPETERYQGIVPLEGASLAECAHTYFRQSDQLAACVKLAARRDGDGAWRAGGLMLQRLGQGGVQRQSGEAADERAEDDWRRMVVLVSSSTGAELLDRALHPHALLWRLFHEDQVRVFAPRPLDMRCRCSQNRVETMLRAFPRADIEELKIESCVVVTCEFCGKEYRFDDQALDDLYGS